MFVSLIATLVVLGLLWYLISLIPLPSPFPEIIKVLFILAAIFVVLGAFGVVSAPLIKI